MIRGFMKRILFFIARSCERGIGGFIYDLKTMIFMIYLCKNV